MTKNTYRWLPAWTKALRGGLSERTRTKVKFEQDDFDFFFQWFAGLQTHGGVESGEIFYAASKITDGDAESWADVWRSLSGRVEARARGCLDRGHRVSARQAFFRAYNYRRAPLVFMRPNDPRYRPTYEAARELFRIAASLCEHALEPFSIPFEAGALSGYMLRPDGTYERMAVTDGQRAFNCHKFFMENPSLSGRGTAGAKDVPALTHSGE